MIMEAAREMIHDQDLPMHLQAEAARTVVYVQNRTPHRVLKNKTPEEVFSSKKPEVIHLRIFGCPMYIHIPKEKRRKLYPLGKKGIFVGYSEEAEAPRIHDTIMNEETQEEDQEFEEPQEPVDPPQEKKSSQEETFLGKRSYLRCRKIWGSRRESERKKENQVLL